MSDPYRVYADGIDDDMKRLQWVCWENDENRGKIPKRPDNPRRNARSNDATTWGSFSEALNMAEGRDFGVGLPLAQASPFIALDIDIPDDGDWVPDVDRLGGAVVERSPSENRRVLLRDVEIPSWWKNQGEDGPDTREIKVFDDSGYVATTGDVLDSHGPPIGKTSQVAFETWLKDAWRAFHDEDDEEPWREPERERDERRGSQSTTGKTGSVDGDWLTEDHVREALDHIDPDISHDKWRNIGYALADHFDRGTARSLFVQWSRGGSKWSENAGGQVSSIIDEADPAGVDDVTIATVVHFAKEGGWKTPRQRSVGDRLAGDDKGESEEASTDGGTAAADPKPLAGANDHHRDEDDAGVTGDGWDSLPVHNSRGNIDTRETRRRVADILLENNEFATPKPEGINTDKTPLFRYWAEEGFYERSGAAWVNRRLAKKAPYLESADINEIVNHLRRSSFVDWEAFDAGDFDETLVNLGNGVYDLDSGELREHDPKYLFRTSIPRVYDPDAECPAIEEFLDDVVADDAERDTLIEWIGYCLEVGYPIHRFLILYGGGRNGKSVYFRLAREFLSDDNVSGVTLDTIASGGFGVSALDDNLLNVDTESADTRLKPSQLNTLKALSGGDQRQVDVKYEEPHEMENSAKLAFAANNPPRFEEDTDAVADRLLTIEFPFRFGNDANADKPAVPERRLMASLTTEEELSGLLNLALQGLERVRERGYFSIEEGTTARERFTAYMSEADSIVGFANHCLENSRDFALPKPAVYAAYKTYCAENEHSPAEESAFFRQLGRKTDVETYPKHPRVVTEASNSEYRTKVLDHLWFTEAAIDHLSQSAQDDVVLTVAHMHASSVEKATEQLHRESIGVLADRVLRTLREMDGDEDGYVPRGALFARVGVAPSRGNKAIKRLRDRSDIAVDGTDFLAL